MALSKITNDGVATSGLPAGSVVQVVQASSTSVLSTSSSTFAASGFSATITPTSSSNKILVMGSLPIYLQGISGGAHGIVTVYRGGVASGTDISASTSSFGLAQNYAAGIETITKGSFHVLDSPATTSSTTYELAFRVNGSTSCTIAINGDEYTLTLMEIVQ